MMASFMSYFTGRRDAKQTARDAIVLLREQLMMIEKKEEHLQRQIAQDLATAKANAVSNKNGTPSSSPPFLGQSLIKWSWLRAQFPFYIYIFSVFWVSLSGHCCA